MTSPDAQMKTEAGHSWIESGHGTPLVLVHGIGGTVANWRPVMDALAEDHRVLAWSFPGYEGARPLGSDRPAAGDYADRLADFLDGQGIAKAHVVGHSLGALVVAALAQAHPGLVGRMDLVCPVVGAGGLPEDRRRAVRDGRAGEIRTEGMQGFAEARTASIVGPQVRPGDLEEIVATMAGIGADAYLQAWEMLCASDILPMLTAGAVPARVMGGAVDPVAPPDAVRAVAAALEVTPVILPEIGHFPTYEAPEALIDLITAHP